MNPYAVLAAAAAQWERIAGLLDAGTRERLAAHLSRIRRDGPDPCDQQQRHAAASRAVEVLADGLPELFGSEQQARLTATPPPAGLSAENVTHLGFSAEDLAVLLVDGHRMVGSLLSPVRERLLAAPALEPDTVFLGGADPYAVGLIRLSGRGGAVRLPSFQFTADHRPRPIVLDVNRILTADRDPWGAADWWLTINGWLDARPEALIGTTREQQLPNAARMLTDAE
ncbi:hypothetical protein H8N01_19005 [Streptomyces sp. AC536]|uniref:hypothetical protein n=1 Tax=Streptomyces buecherae TaxID=2763006 RepID=UPI00164DCBDA|nr:hypothetical protein [Streptomyces buecherae]MBC3984602.1 hypothetical protein [Streptomyces buecherae]QNJ39519.1 hypothetical protein H7H31_06170 [Streptomyces buecherae]